MIATPTTNIRTVVTTHPQAGLRRYAKATPDCPPPVAISDGTVIWTAPSGTTYTTHPGSRLFFPSWDVTTADIAAAIQAERQLNQHDTPPF